MPTDFLHGVETVTIDSGPRPVQTIRSSVIGLIGTAPLADAEVYPLDTPVLVNSRAALATLGATGTLPDALDGIFNQHGAFVVMVRVAESVNADPAAAWAETMANVIGGVNVDTGVMTGVQAFRAAESVLGVSPMILIAPSFTGERPVGVATVPILTQGVAYATAPTVAFVGGTGTGATAHAILGTGANAGKVVSIVVDNPGRYTVAPTSATLTGGGFTTAATLGAPTIAAGPNPVVSALLPLANMLRAHIVAEGPNTTDAAALAYRNDWSSRRIFIVDPMVKVYDTVAAAYVQKPNSSRVAGLISRIDYEVGFWKSPSNEVVNGIGGLGRPVDWSSGDVNSRANLLNSSQVATFIRDEGWRLWGNRTASSDAKWAFLSTSRTADMIDASIQRAHRFAVDKSINKGYYSDVTASVKGYMRQLVARGAILGGDCWVDPAFNSPADIAAGHATFSYDFTVPSPAERVTFRSTVTDAYIASIFA